MSGVAGLVYWDGRLVEPGVIEGMTGAMQHRGPDGITHWRQGPVALGQCMLRTTPESLEESLPLANGDGSLVLVMDGRVDNAPELRRELLGRGAVLRSRADAELVLRAYEAWGEDCVRHIVGECVFFVWDARRQTLFAGRDAAGTRHFYYHAGPGWLAFASEIKGLLTLPGIPRRVNDSRVLDYLVPAFDRDDQTGTFWEDILRLPAGNAMRATAHGVETWRWWNPAELEPLHFASLAECTEAFMAQLQEAVKCRLRHIRPVGAMLSGGMDSSTIVGLISHRLRDELTQPLRTVSLVREDRENCTDWKSISAILQADPWLQPTVMDASTVNETRDRLCAAIAVTDEPFSWANGLTYHLCYQAARDAGCGVLLDGMAGDLLFRDGSASFEEVVRRRRLDLAGGLLQAGRNHGWPRPHWEFVTTWAKTVAPHWLRAVLRQRRDRQRLSSGDLQAIRPEWASSYLQGKRSSAYRAGHSSWSPDDLRRHARLFMSGQASFAHENYGLLAFANGVEPRSAYSDRRVIEFAVRMPLEAKLAIPWYKNLLREGTEGMLPDAVRWRSDTGNHPGWTFYDRLAALVEADALAELSQGEGGRRLQRWLASPEMETVNTDYGDPSYSLRLERLSRYMLAAWLKSASPYRA